MNLGRIYLQVGRCWEALREVEGSSAAMLWATLARPRFIRDVRLTLDAKEGRPMPSRVRARLATTGIYLLYDLPRDLHAPLRGVRGSRCVRCSYKPCARTPREPGHHSQMRNRARRL